MSAISFTALVSSLYAEKSSLYKDLNIKNIIQNSYMNLPKIFKVGLNKKVSAKSQKNENLEDHNDENFKRSKRARDEDSSNASQRSDQVEDSSNPTAEEQRILETIGKYPSIVAQMLQDGIQQKQEQQK